MVFNLCLLQASLCPTLCRRVGQTLHNTTKGFQRIPVKKNCFQTLPITTNGWTNLCSSCWLLYTIKRPPPGLSKKFLSFRFLLSVCYGGAFWVMALTLISWQSFIWIWILHQIIIDQWQIQRKQNKPRLRRREPEARMQQINFLSEIKFLYCMCRTLQCFPHWQSGNEL